MLEQLFAGLSESYTRLSPKASELLAALQREYEDA